MPKMPSETAAINVLVSGMKSQLQRPPLTMKLTPLASTSNQLTTDEMLARADAAAARDAGLEVSSDADRVKKVELIAVDLIDDSPYQPRTVYDQQIIKDRAASIAQQGQLDPLKLRRMANGRYEQLDGHYRIRSMRDELDWKFVEAIVYDVDDATARAYVMTYTEARTDISSFERALMYQSAIAAGTKASALAKSLGVSRAHISQCMIFTKLPGSFQDVLKSHPRLLSYRGAEGIVNLIAEFPDQVDLLFVGFKVAVKRRMDAFSKAKESDGVDVERYEVNAASLRSWLHKRQNNAPKAAKVQSRFVTDTHGANVIEIKKGAKPDEIVIRTLATDPASRANIEDAIFEMLRIKYAEQVGNIV